MTINLSTSNAKLVLTSAIPVLTSGMKNAVYCEFTFDADWNGLEKVAVFRAGPKSIAVHEANWTTENKLPIPWEVLTEPKQTLYIGVCGESNDVTVIPTIWCRIADIRRGTDADAPEGREPTTTVWAHLEDEIANANNNIDELQDATNKLDGNIGNLQELVTEHKNDLVTAVNEAYHRGVFYVEYGNYDNFDQLRQAVDSFQAVYCIEGDGQTVGLAYVTSYDEAIYFTRPDRTATVYIVAERRDDGGIDWSRQVFYCVDRDNPETKGNVYMTANGTHTGNAKYIGVLFDNSAVENDEDEEALEAHADDPRLKLHGGTRNVDIMATTAEDGKNAVELLGDNKKDNTYLGGLLDPRDGHPHDAANKGYVDSRINAFTVTLAYNAWQAVEPETRSEEPNSDTEAEEDTTIYEQTVNVAALRDVGASEEVTIQICPQPAAIAAWGKYGVVCVEAVAGEFETDGSMTFRANARPATNENISVNVTLLR